MTRPSLPIRLITPADVRASIRRARRSLEQAAEEIVWQIEMEAWRTLGYPSWTAMREAEYGGAAFMVPAKNRPELVERMRAKGLTQQEIADTAGVAGSTVSRDLANASSDPADTITNSRGQQRPSSYSRNEDRTNVRSDAPVSDGNDADDDVIDAEIVDDEPALTEEECRALADPADWDDEETVTPDKATDPAPAEPVDTVTCPTCHGTGKVTR